MALICHKLKLNICSGPLCLIYISLGLYKFTNMLHRNVEEPKEKQIYLDSESLLLDFMM